MTINAISAVTPNVQYLSKTNVNFRQAENTGSKEATQDKFVSGQDDKQYYLKAKGGKKFGMVLTSLVPWGGHIANGQFGKAILATLGLSAGFAGTAFGTMALMNSASRAMNKAAIPVAIAGGALTLAGYIWNIVDSVKSSTKKINIYEA